jgi:peptide/nickel transport system permease protein
MTAPKLADGAPTTAIAGPVLRVSETVSRRREIRYFLLRSRKVLIAATILVVLVALAVVGPILRPGDPNEFVGPLSAPPSAEYWFGTTTFGQDVFAQFVAGLGATFLVGLTGGGLAAVIGVVVGFVAGYRGGVVDEVLTMITNVVLVIPTLALLLVVTAYLQARGLFVEAAFIGLTSWPWAARAIRAQTFSLNSREFVDLARISGVASPRVIFGEIAPNMSSYLFMTFILLFGGSILIAASLDFIGPDDVQRRRLERAPAGHVVVVRPARRGDHRDRRRALRHERRARRDLQPTASGVVSR